MKRVCKKCGIEKDLSCFRKNKKCKLGYLFCCRECAAKTARVDTAKHRSLNPQKQTEQYAKYKNKKLILRKTQIKELNDSYVKSQLKKWGVPSPTKELTDLKKIHLKLKREIYGSHSITQ